MTLQTSGTIAFSNINTELQRGSTNTLSLNDSQARTLAGVPSGAISLSNFYGKVWLTADDAVTWFVNNREASHNWVHGGSGDTRYVNNPYDRYTSSTAWTYTPSFSGVTSRWTTIVLIALESGVSSLNYSINGGWGVSSDQLVWATGYGGNLYMRVLQINTDIKNINNIYTQWNHGSGNSGTWASCAVIPGRWSAEAVQGNVTLSDNQIAVGGGTADIGNGAGTTLASADGMPYHYFDAWWYNNGQHWMLANNTGSTRTGSFNQSEAFSARLTFQEG